MTGAISTAGLRRTDAEGPLRPQHVIEAIAAKAAPGTIVAAGVDSTRCGPRSTGSSKSPAPGSLRGAGRWIRRPAAIGAKVGRPDRTVWCIDGDGCFQMTARS